MLQRSPAQLRQRRAFMQRDVVGLVTFDLILRIIWAGVMRIAFIRNVSGMDFDDDSADPAGFRIPAHVIANFEPSRHVYPMPVLSNAKNIIAALGRPYPA